MTSTGLGEFGRIARFFAPLAGPGGLGLMDDAALVECAPGHRLVVTVDQAIENIHFLPDDPPGLVAKKLLRRNLSDLAAMGARPLHYLLTTALPADRDDDWLEAFAAGLAEDQAEFGVDLIGGDSASINGPVSLTITAIGEVAEDREIRRSGARAGDRIWVSGTIGDAVLGLKVLRGGYPFLAAADRAALARRFQLPEPRVALGLRLVGIAHAMCDVSDGLLADLGHICEASGTGATVRLPALPLSPAARRAAGDAPDLLAHLATGGDDYELVFAAPPQAEEAIGRLAAELGLPLTAVGTIDEAEGVRLLGAGGAPIAVATAGYRHF